MRILILILIFTFFKDREYTIGGHILVDDALKNKWFPEGYPTQITKTEHVWNQDRSLLGRQIVGDIITELTTQKNDGFLQSRGARSLILDGLLGAGKSITLLHTLLWARSSGWFALYIPSGMLFSKQQQKKKIFFYLCGN